MLDSRKESYDVNMKQSAVLSLFLGDRHRALFIDFQPPPLAKEYEKKALCPKAGTMIKGWFVKAPTRRHPKAAARPVI